jgi:hypothetical protein
MLNWHTFYPQCSTHTRTHILRPMTLPGNGYLHVPIVGQEAENKPQQQHFPRLAVVPPWPVSSVSTNLSTTSLSLSLSLAVSPVSPGLLPPGLIHLHLAAPALRSLSSLRLGFLLLLPIRGEPERPPLKSQSFTGGTLLRSSVHLINGQLYGVPLPENSGKLYKGGGGF